MSKQDQVLSEDTVKVRDEMGVGGMAAALVVGGPLGLLGILAFGDAKYETTIRDEDKNVYTGTGSTKSESRGAAYAKMK